MSTDEVRMQINYFMVDIATTIDGVFFRPGEWTAAYETDGIVRRAMNGQLTAQKALQRVAVDLAPPVVTANVMPLEPVTVSYVAATFTPEIVNVPQAPIAQSLPVVPAPVFVAQPVVLSPEPETVLPVDLPVKKSQTTKRERPQ
jgi:hypothetical protein